MWDTKKRSITSGDIHIIDSTNYDTESEGLFKFSHTMFYTAYREIPRNENIEVIRYQLLEELQSIIDSTGNNEATRIKSVSYEEKDGILTCDHYVKTDNTEAALILKLTY